MKAMRIVVAVLCVAVAPAAVARAAEKESLFRRISSEIGAVVKLTLADKSLVLDRSHWEAEPEPPAAQPQPGVGVGVGVRIGIGGKQTGIDGLFQKLGRAAGSMGFSTMVSGDSRQQSFSGGGLVGKLEVAGDRVQILLRETDDPGNDLTVTDDAKGGLRIIFTNAKGDILMVAQNASGRVTVAHVAPGVTFTGSAASFPAFYRENSPYVEQHLLPFLQGLGVRVFPGRSSAAVVGAVCRLLRPLSPEEQAEFKQLLAGMDDADFDRREAATGAMSKAASRYWPLIQEALKNPPSEEVKTRLAKVASEGAEHREIAEVIAALDLLNDAEYLTALGRQVTGDDEAAVARRLRQLADGARK